MENSGRRPFWVGMTIQGGGGTDRCLGSQIASFESSRFGSNLSECPMLCWGTSYYVYIPRSCRLDYSEASPAGGACLRRPADRLLFGPGEHILGTSTR